MIYYVDIDETICDYKDEKKYELASPILDNILKINKLYDEGSTVIYWTARGSVTGIDWADLTKAQLLKWGAKHHNLILGKPHYDVFICDKAINSSVFFGDNKK